jgi:uncharacterized protein YqhQ
MDAFLTWLGGLDNFWLQAYIVVSIFFTAYFFVRLFMYSFKEIAMMSWRLVWGIILVPVLMGVFWPVSMFNRIFMKRWISNWMNHMHWWEE